MTPTTNENALNWRKACRLRIEHRAAVPTLRHRDVIEFEQAITFLDGATHQRLEVRIDPRRPRRIRFRASDGRSAYRVGDYRKRPFTVVSRGGQVVEPAANRAMKGTSPTLQASKEGRDS